MPLRRYEILLPLQYNNGDPIESEKFIMAHDELLDRFGAVSIAPGTIQGSWRHKGKVYEDESVRMFVDVDDSPEVNSFFVEWKEVIKSGFSKLRF